jgi:two-component system NtrC family response regulator
MQKVSVTASGPVVMAGDLQIPAHAADPIANQSPNTGVSFHDAIANLEKSLLEQALLEAGGNRSKAAELLKMRRQLFYAKLKEHRLDNAS